MSSTILSGDFTIFYAAENNQKRIKWTGSATGTRTLNELYSALQNLFDDPAQMDDLVPMKADTPDIYRIQNQWFIDDDSVEHLKTGSLFSDKWKDGTTEHILVIGYAETVEFNPADIGRTIRGATTTDTGTILDFNATRGLIWIRPDDPLAAGDEFDNGTETYSIGAAANGDPADKVWQIDDPAGTPSYVDETVDFNDADPTDVDPWPATEAVGDQMAVGFAQKFSKLNIDVGTAGVGGTLAWKYWNGSAWTALAAVVDDTVGFTVLGVNKVTFTVPSDWATRSLNGSAQLYYVVAEVATLYTTNPVLDQGWVSGVGAGAFASHTRHGAASKAGESAWAGATSIGSLEPNSHVYIFQESPDQAAASYNETKVIATKGTSDWWGDGHINILLKVKEADSLFGTLPGSTPATGIATVLARQYSKTFSHFLATALATAGGNTVIPLSAADDLDNTTGYRRFTGSGGSGTFNVDNYIYVGASWAAATKKGVITAVGGTVAAPILTYYLIGDPLTDFVDTDAVVEWTGSANDATCTAGTPADVGPAVDTTITTTFGITTEDIQNGAGARQYAIRINPATLAIERVYERMKYITRRGSVTSLQGQDGEEYVGAELQITYSGQTGNFTAGLRITGGTSLAEGVIVADQDDGTTGYLIVKEVRGTFQIGETITDTSTGSAAIATGGLRTVAPVAGAPFGTFAGGKFFGAPAVCLTTANLATGDEQAYQLIDNTGATQKPPNTVSMIVDNLVSGDTVAVFKRSGAAIVKNQFTLAAGNNVGGTTVVVNETILANEVSQDDDSKIRVISPSGEEHRYRYDSYVTSTFTLAPASAGTATGGTATQLLDTGATFVTDGVQVGDYVRNTTEGKFVRVTAVVSNTELTTEAVTGWSGDAYSVNTLVETYPTNTEAYTPILEVKADATPESAKLPDVTSTVTIRVDVRNAGVILPFTQDTTLETTGKTVSAIRSEDAIYS